MNVYLLYKDELTGFYKSKAMIILWIGMPLLTILMRSLQLLQTSAPEIPFTLISVLLISEMGGILSSIMLSTSIVNEKNKKVYDLFLIRPVKRYELILAKYLAVISCMIIAVVVSVIFGIIIDYFMDALPTTIYAWNTYIENIVASLVSISMSCCLGILFGIILNSVVAASLLSIYVGNQSSLIFLIAIFMIDESLKLLLSSIIGPIVTIGLMILNIIIFNKKQF